MPSSNPSIRAAISSFALKGGSNLYCESGYYYTRGSDDAGSLSPDTCTAHSTCVDGKYISTPAGDEQNRLCTDCTLINNDASDITYTCTTASDTRINTGNSGIYCERGY